MPSGTGPWWISNEMMWARTIPAPWGPTGRVAYPLSSTDPFHPQQSLLTRSQNLWTMVGDLVWRLIPLLYHPGTGWPGIVTRHLIATPQYNHPRRCPNGHEEPAREPSRTGVDQSDGA